MLSAALRRPHVCRVLSEKQEGEPLGRGNSAGAVNVSEPARLSAELGGTHSVRNLFLGMSSGKVISYI